MDLSTFDPVLWSRKRWEKAPLRLTFKAENRKQAEVWQKKLRSKVAELAGGFRIAPALPPRDPRDARVSGLHAAETRV